MILVASASAVVRAFSHRTYIGLITPPRAPTMPTPAMVARIMISTGVVTGVATSSDPTSTNCWR